VSQAEIEQIFYTKIAFYLPDGTTARKEMDIPLGQDEATFVYNYLKQNTFIEVDSMDIESSDGLYIICSHVVAFIINP